MWSLLDNTTSCSSDKIVQVYIELDDYNKDITCTLWLQVVVAPDYEISRTESLNSYSFELAELPAKACIPKESEQNHGQTKDLVSVTGIPRGGPRGWRRGGARDTDIK